MPAETVREKALLEKPRLTREQIAGRAALELPDGAYVNLGWGIPNLIANYLPGEITVYFHSENGILGMGRRAKPGEEDYDLVDAMKIPVTLIPGASFFHQADAHLMTRGGHLDVAVLGGFQVSEKGDLANWKIPGAKGSGGIGGAMDISAGRKGPGPPHAGGALCVQDVAIGHVGLFPGLSDAKHRGVEMGAAGHPVRLGAMGKGRG